jgi:hypothetical protein
MDTLQIQISQLQDKTNRLYELVEQMNNRLDGLDNRQPEHMERESYSLPNFASGMSSAAKNRKPDYQLTHKDVLVDDNSSTSSTNSSSDNLAPDTQIRRLTAQLTAAYNRIAALEEQLLTYRIHS